MSAQSVTWTTLPAEVRVKVYHYLFIAEKTISFEATEQDAPQLSSQLLRCNKAILTEARPILYTNVFDVDAWDDIFRYGNSERDPKGVFADETKRAFWKTQLRHIAVEYYSANCTDLVAQMQQMPHLQSIQMRLMGQHDWEAETIFAPTAVDNLPQSRSIHGNPHASMFVWNFPSAAVYYCVHLQEEEEQTKKVCGLCHRCDPAS
jgi:hypothetical protein